MRPAGPSTAAMAMTRAEFDAFYDRALPVVFGYLSRLCGGDRDRAWDLTQDVWVTLADQLAQGHPERATIGWLISVARTRYLDQWRRQQRLARKLRLIWSTERPAPAGVPEVPRAGVLEHLAGMRPDHRVVLTLRYLDDLPLEQVAHLIGASRSATYSLLDKARTELRRRIRDDRSGGPGTDDGLDRLEGGHHD
jgi:RNA polymerase sigma-70 factor, ECF subfamily